MGKSQHKQQPVHNSRGLGLIELLCTIIIVSFGILGLALLQVKNTISINNNINNIKATFYAENLVQKINGNKVLARTVNSPYIIPAFTDTPTTAATTPLCITSTCTHNELAIYDITTWLYIIKTSLPSGKAKVIQTSSGASILYTITIQWKNKTNTSEYTIVTQI